MLICKFTKKMFSKELLDTLFKAYDIRGTYPDQLTSEFYYAYGRAFAQVLKPRRVAVGRDMRISSDEFAEALIAGLSDQGVRVVDLGMVASDMVYFATGKYGYDAGLMITASHNPKEYNGLKGCLRNAEPLSVSNGSGKIKELMGEEMDFPKAERAGAIEQKDILADWVSFVLSFVNKKQIPAMKLVVDAGNGMGGKVMEVLCKEVPQLELIPLYFEPDGNFPNHPAYPLDEINLVDLKGRMEQEGATLGMAFDGDADRVVLVDDKFETVSGTVMTALISVVMLDRYPGATIVYNALVGDIVPELIKEHGGESVRSRVGHTFLKESMRENKAIFGGEHSAHYYFKDNWNADSGIIAAMIVLGVLAESGKKMSELREEYAKYPESGEINFKAQDIPLILAGVKDVFKEFEQDRLDGITIRGDDWWVNVRPSNTEPLLRLNVEARTREKVEELVAKVRSIIVG